MSHPSSIADVRRTHWPVEVEKSLNLYLGTGRCGGCFDSYGLQHQDHLSPVATRVSNTWLAHGEVWHRGRHGLDNQVPLAHLRWDNPPGLPINYHQHLELAAGRLTTEFVGQNFRYTLTAFTSPAAAERDVLCFHLEWSGAQRPALVFSPVVVYPSDYSGELVAACTPALNSSRASLDIVRGNSHGLALAACSGDLQPAILGDHIVIRLNATSGSGTLRIALGPITRAAELNATLDRLAPQPAAALRTAAESAWLTRWGRTDITLTRPDYRDLAWRSVYHILCSYAPDVRCPPPPMGFTGNAWGYHFPQDLSYVHPALNYHGHTDITRAHVEFYHSRIDNQRALTREIYDRPGICWSWEFPIGPDARLFRPEDGGAPNEFQYEVHNAAYPARMAADTAAALADPAWTRDIAWPVIRESARFLASCLSPESDGTYSFQVTPSMGQDEFGGQNAKNYLCALFATEYTLGQAVALAQKLGVTDDESTRWSQVLQGGLAYRRLLLPDHGFYAANESTAFVPRQQKHPVQLNPLWILPFEKIDEPTLQSYRQRRVICSTERDNQRHGGVPTGFYDGWTLFAFQLSAARLGDSIGLTHERAEMVPSRAIDPDFTTIYESSGYWRPYYTTSMGLFLQAAHLIKPAPISSHP